MSAQTNLTAGMCIQYTGLESVSSISGYKNWPNSKQLSFFLLSFHSLYVRTNSFSKAGDPGAPKPLKQAFLLPMLNAALHSCPQKLVSTAEKKCLIERHKPSALEMGSAQNIWNWIKKKKLPKISKGDSFPLFYKCQLQAFFLFLVYFVCMSFINYIFPSFKWLLFLHYLSTFSSFYPSNFSYFICTVSLHFQMSLRLLRTAHTLKCACQPPALGESGGRVWGGISFSPPSFPTDADSGGWILLHFLPTIIWSLLTCHLQLSGKSTLTLALTAWTLPLTDGERKKPSHRRIRTTISYIIILRFEQLVQQEISHMTPCLLSKWASAWVLSTTTLSSSRSLDCQAWIFSGKKYFKYLSSVSLTVK